MKAQSTPIAPSYPHPCATVTARGTWALLLASGGCKPPPQRAALGVGLPGSAVTALWLRRWAAGWVSARWSSHRTGHWGHFPALAFMNEAAINIHAGVSLKAAFHSLWVAPTREGWALE